MLGLSMFEKLTAKNVKCYCCCIRVWWSGFMCVCKGEEWGASIQRCILPSKLKPYCLYTWATIKEGIVLSHGSIVELYLWEIMGRLERVHKEIEGESVDILSHKWQLKHRSREIWAIQSHFSAIQRDTTLKELTIKEARKSHVLYIYQDFAFIPDYLPITGLDNHVLLFFPSL